MATLTMKRQANEKKDGVGEALQLKYLESFVISFHNGPVAPDTVAEAYVLNFTYSGPDREPHVDIVSKEETVGLTVKDMTDLKSLYKRLITLASSSVSSLEGKHTFIALDTLLTISSNTNDWHAANVQRYMPACV